MIAVAEKYAVDVRMRTPITSERQHEEYLSVLEMLIGKKAPTRGEDQYAGLLATLIEADEEEHFPILDASPVDVLRTLMEANDLRQKDLASLFGSESVVSEILNGKREINKNHIDKLSKRFNC